MQFGGFYTQGSIIRRPKQALYYAIAFFIFSIFLLLSIRNSKNLVDIEIGLIFFIFSSAWGVIFLIAEKKKWWKRNLKQLKKIREARKIN